ncbi:MAG: hypothetical protein RBR58_04065 [Candidatus Humimicrobiaceae bacterium]|jgi:hypothetical protein|nr:hypothetical protein [Actinomycetota bacterium]MDD5600787.1 hypothetical protein [Actinomycetota bacterium]MDY0028157.1 hypothetical protein [Candidatus Humimicrobiaceae bacterium]
MNRKKNKLLNITKKSNSNRGPENYGGIISIKNKALIRKKCKENPNFKKSVIIKEDGRYLIYYEF